MLTRKITKRGNSLAIRIPKSVAKKLHLKPGDPVFFDPHPRPSLARHPRRSKYKLSQLLAGNKGPYPHRRVFADPPIGR